MEASRNARRHRLRALPAVATAVVLVAAYLAVNPSAAGAGVATPATAGQATVEQKFTPQLRQQFADGERSPAQDFWVRFDTRADLSAAYDIDDWVERGEYVVRQLEQAATAAQAGTIDLLDAAGVEYESYWVTNAIRIDGGSYRLASRVAQRPEVTSLVEPGSYETPDPEMTPSGGGAGTQAVEWGLTNINADDAWQQGIDGSGIVVANIDTGVQFDHPTLVNQYRGNNGGGSFTHDYHWFDASGNCDGAPCDTHGHGTHTMGTMVGSDGNANQIGVAPGATWIAANGCQTCSRQHIMDSAEWLLAPTRLDGTGRDPAMRPNIINNSWGSTAPTVDPWFDDMTRAWAAAGIFGVFSNGNNGPDCQTSGSPGSSTVSYSVGAYDEANTIAAFSSRGPGEAGDVKPNISAPGVQVRSAYPGDRMAVANGTSMAAPHVAGAIGLLWSAAPDLLGEIEATRDLLDVTAVDTEDLQCGGTPDDNNVYGEGRLDVLPLVSGRRVGVLEGRVTDQETGEGIAGARVRIVGGGDQDPIDRTVIARADGSYRAGLLGGQYDVTASAYAYLDRTVPGVSITEGDTTTQDLRLEPASSAVVTGRVADGSGQGWPLPATVTIDGYPGEPVFTDPVTGEYQVRLMSSAEYTLTIDPLYQGYPTVVEPLRLGDEDLALEHPVAADLAGCTAPGYTWNGTDHGFTGWTGTTPQHGWDIQGKQGAWRFDNPQHRQQPFTAEGAFPIADPAAQPRGRLDSTLTSPPLDLTGHTAPELMLDMRYLGAPKHQRGSIEFSTDGRAWHPVWSATAANVTGIRTFPLPGAAGHDSVQLRFSFTGRGDTYWAFDNVFVGTRECLPRDGGLLVGDVTDQASGVGLVNTVVRLESHPDAYVRSQPGVDPAGAGARYWLFAPGEGEDHLLAQAAHYQPFRAGVTIVPHQITHQNIELRAAEPAGSQWR